MQVDELLSTARDTMTARRVFAEPYEKDGVTVIGVAKVRGGGGGGEGTDKNGQAGQGGGFGLAARPTGAFVIRDGNVRWMPAVDPQRIAMVVGAVAIAWLLTRPFSAAAHRFGRRHS
jgi:uncharacterized spore protein YtfJ